MTLLTNTTVPAPGEVWEVHPERGAVVVAAVRETFVLAWPLTALTAATSAPAVRVEVAGREFAAWPEAEFGLGLDLLGRRLDSVFEASALRAIWAAVSEGTAPPADSPVAFLPPNDSDEALQALSDACMLAWELGEAGSD